MGQRKDSWAAKKMLMRPIALGALELRRSFELHTTSKDDIDTILALCYMELHTFFSKSVENLNQPQPFLIGGIPTPSEEYEFVVNWDDDYSQYFWNTIQSCSNHHQPTIHYVTMYDP